MKEFHWPLFVFPLPIATCSSHGSSSDIPSGQALRRSGRLFGALGSWNRPALWIRLILTGIVAAAIIRELPREISRWYLAAAREQSVDLNDHGALERIDRAIDWSRDDYSLYLIRAAWRLQAKQPDGSLADCNQAIRLAPADRRGYELRWQVHMVLGHVEPAMADVQVLVERAQQAYQESKTPAHRFRYAESLNARAYGRALSNQKLELAIEDINLAFGVLESEDLYSLRDTRGYLYFLTGNYQAARKDLDYAVRQGRIAYSIEMDMLNQPERTVSIDRQLRFETRSRKEGLAVLFYHRGLLHERLGYERKAKEDLHTALEYGYDPSRGIW